MAVKSDTSGSGTTNPVEIQMLDQARAAQPAWAQTSVRERVSLIRRVRRLIATTAVAFAHTVQEHKPGSLHRSVADTLVAEVLPLVEACRFLEREAKWILAQQRLDTRARPFWLRRVWAETIREPLGVVLIIAPANYPLFLPGVQALQALVAGNAVLWKPAPGGSATAQALRTALVTSGLDPALLQILAEPPQTAAAAIHAGVDKVFLTGSSVTGAAVLNQLAPRLTPSVMELSGCDAVFVLPGANYERAVAALEFGLRFNGSATCMAPRRLFLAGPHPGFIAALLERLEQLPPVPLSEPARQLLVALLDDATHQGATVRVFGADDSAMAVGCVVLQGATVTMTITQTDIFAPVLSVFETNDLGAAVDAHAACPYRLTAAIFGPEDEARRLAARLPVNTVLINDLIVAAADPRVSFGGRGASGFGLSRGREGLLEMTTLKTVVVQRSRDLRPYRPTGAGHEEFFAAWLEVAHGSGLRKRWQGMRRLVRAAMHLD